MKFKKLVNAIIDKVLEVLPYVWGVLIVCSITGVLLGTTIWSIEWILKLLGVI